eukprot:14157.XXX_369370_369633_1 [CDS] Oithona nana genome sequencing.
MLSFFDRSINVNPTVNHFVYSFLSQQKCVIVQGKLDWILETIFAGQSDVIAFLAASGIQNTFEECTLDMSLVVFNHFLKRHFDLAIS